MLALCEVGCDPLDRTGQRRGGERVVPAGKMQRTPFWLKAPPHGT